MSAPEPVGVIDIGSSAIRLLIAEVASDGTTRVVDTASKAVRLGRDAFTDGVLGAKTIDAACKVLRGFRRILAEHGVTQVRAVATSAVREAENRDTFLDRVATRADLEVEVLDAADEARLTYLAARTALRGHEEIEKEPTLFVEVGGGGTDLAFLVDGQPAHSGAFPLGAIRVRSRLDGLSGGRKAWVKALRSEIRNSLSDIRREIPLLKARHLVALGGDMRFAARRLTEDASSGETEAADEPVRSVPREAFLEFSRRVGKIRPERLVDKLGLGYPQVEMLVPALLIYREILRSTKAEVVLVPRTSLRDAVLEDLARRTRGEGEDEPRRQILGSAEGLVEKYAADLDHARRVTRLSGRLFDDMLDLHRLGPREKTLLLAAATLHDIGLFVSTRSHHKHGEYLIRASQIFGLSEREREIVGCVARYHRRALPKPTHPSFMALDRKERRVVSKLGALLRLANALDRDRSERIRDVKAHEEKDRWVIEVDGDGTLDMERLSIEQRSDMFREVFGHEIRLREGRRE